MGSEMCIRDRAVFAAESGDVSDGVLPPLEVVPEMSLRVAMAVARTACDEGLAEPMTDEEIEAAVRERAWTPTYIPLA